MAGWYERSDVSLLSVDYGMIDDFGIHSTSVNFFCGPQGPGVLRHG